MRVSGRRLAGAGGKMQYLVHDFNDNTIRFVLYYPGIVDADILCAATKAVVESVDVLHASFFTDKIGAFWNVNKGYEESSFFRMIETQGDLRRHCKDGESEGLCNICPARYRLFWKKEYRVWRFVEKETGDAGICD